MIGLFVHMGWPLQRSMKLLLWCALAFALSASPARAQTPAGPAPTSPAQIPAEAFFKNPAETCRCG